MLGTQEIVLIVLAVIILFGANKIPELARSLGMATGEFKKAQQDTEKELKNIEKSLKEDVKMDDDSDKVKQMAKDLGIKVEGKGDEELLDEMKEKIKK